MTSPTSCRGCSTGPPATGRPAASRGGAAAVPARPCRAPGPAGRRPPRHPRLGQQPRPRPVRGGDQHSRPATLDEDTLTRCRRVLGDDHPATLASANNLARDLCALGEYQQARALDEDTLTRRRRVLGDDHPDTLTSASNLAPTCTRWASTSRPATWTRTPSPAAGGSSATTTPTPSPRPATSPATCTRWASTSRPATLDEDTLTRCRRVLGDDHPDTLTSASNLARDLHALGEHQQARDLDEDTLTRRRRVLGDDHPDTLISASNLARDLRALGEHQQAQALEAQIRLWKSKPGSEPATF